MQDQCRYLRNNFDSHPDYFWYKSVANSALIDYPQILKYDLYDTLCNDNFCFLAKNGKLLYLYPSHLNFVGSSYVAPYIIKAINFSK